MENKDIPAFPCTRIENVASISAPVYTPQEVSYSGLTIRDYIAIHAPTEEIAIAGFAYTIGKYLEELASARYRYADAMLKAREK